MKTLQQRAHHPVATHATQRTPQALALRRIAALLLTGLALPALAQDAGTLLRNQQRNETLRPTESPPPPEVQPLAPSRPVPTGQEQAVMLKELRFSGKLALLPPEQRTRLAASAAGQRLGLAGLKALADETTRAIQQQGHVLGYAILPQQDVTEGVVTLELREGRLAATRFERAPGVRADADRLERIVAPLTEADSLDTAALEDALLQLNEHPGLSARARLMAGEQAQTSQLVVALEQTPLFSGSLSADNTGGYTTGSTQATATVVLTDLSGQGDQTRLASTQSDGQHFEQLAFSLPLGASDFSANANLSQLGYHNIDSTGSTLHLQGSAQYPGLGLDYAALRARHANLRLSLSLNDKALVDDSLAGRLQDKRVRNTTLGANGDVRDDWWGGGYTNWSLAWTWGDMDLSRVPSALSADQSSLQTQGAFQRANLQLARLQALPSHYALYGRVYGQWASKNLDSSEDFSLGGPYGVRGYAAGEGRGDKGLVASLELRKDWTPAGDAGQWQFAAFVDAGTIWINTNPDGVATTNACACNNYNLASAGLSARWSWRQFQLSATWAQVLGDNPGRSASTGLDADNARNRERIWLLSTLKF